MNHLTAETILESLEGRLSVDATRDLRAHLASCTSCAKTFSQYAVLLDALHASPMMNAPKMTLQGAFDLFKPPQARDKSLTEMITTLIYDSWRATAPGPGLRGDHGENHSRQVGLSFGDFDLHLSVDYTHKNIRGQVHKRSGEAFEDDFGVRMLDRANQEVASASANALGEFVLYCDPQQGASLILYVPDGPNMRVELPGPRER